jgi:serine/threonine-protein kinase
MLPPQLPENSFEHLRFVGAGSEGIVWRASSGGVPVAIKVLAANAGRQFYQQLRTLLRLRHPHIASVLDFFDSGSEKILVMDFCAGGSLRQRLEAEWAMTLNEATRVARHCAEALTYLHGQGILHGDLKPENILLRRRTGVPAWILCDFGLAVDTRTGRNHRYGTTNYNPPELYSTGRTAASDLFSLGAVLEECIPTEDASPAAEELRSLATELTAVEPSQRPSAQAALDRLRQLQWSDPTLAEDITLPFGVPNP